MVKSEAFLEGYNYQGPKHHNPYRENYSPFPVKVGFEQQEKDWEFGWLTRFYGETI